MTTESTSEIAGGKAVGKAAVAMTEPQQQKKRMMTEQELADEFGFSVRSLRNWRLLGQGPPFVKIGRLCRYDRLAVDRWAAGLPTGGDGVPVSALKRPSRSIRLRS